MLQAKMILKSIVCSVLYYTGILHVYLKWFFLKRGEYPVIIINYHRFVKSYDNIIEVHPSVTHSIDDFKKEINFLTKYFDIRPFDNIVSDLTEGKKFTRPTNLLCRY